MPIAAVPTYLQKKDPEFYLSTPPGHRFLLYFPVWGEDGETNKPTWQKKDRVKKFRRQRGELVDDGWTELENGQFAGDIAACKTPPYEEEKPRTRKPKIDSGLKPWKPMMESLLARQVAAATQIGSDALFCLDATAIAPFTTGLGNEHPLENGFSFLSPYGLPYLPGSGIKGVLRQAARELAGGEWGDSHGWDEEKRYALPTSSEEKPIRLSMLDILFGRESGGGETDHFRGALVFWDVIPQIKGNSLMVEIMTPHQGHYYQEKAFMGSASPHESGQPNPISFLTVPPGSGFVFHVQCDLARLSRLAPDLAADGRWQALLDAVFTHAFDWLGFGAKTAVGYGQMKRKNGNAQTIHDVLSADKASDSVVGSAASCLPDKLVWENAVLTWNPGSQTLSAICDAKRKAEAKLGMDRSMVSEEFITRMKKKKTIRANVTVEPLGNAFRIVSVDQAD